MENLKMIKSEITDGKKVVAMTEGIIYKWRLIRRVEFRCWWITLHRRLRKSKCLDRRIFLHRMQSIEGDLRCRGRDCEDRLGWGIVGMARSERRLNVDQPWLGIWSQRQLLGCISPPRDQASCIRGSSRRKPSPWCMGRDVALHIRTWCSWLSIRGFLRRFRIGIHSPE